MKKLFFLLVLILSGFALQSQVVQKPQNWYNVADYGIKADSTDRTTAIQTLINSVPVGSTVYFPGVKYLTSATITVPAGIRLLGQPSYPHTIVYHNNNTDTAFYFNGAYGIIENMTVSYIGSSTSSSTNRAVAFNGGYGRGTSCTFSNFYINVDYINGGEYKFYDCYFYNPLAYDIKIRDTVNSDDGDGSIIGCTFYNSTSGSAGISHIYYISGGGLRITQCKFNSATNYAAYAVYAPFIGSIDFFFDHNSVENSLGGLDIVTGASGMPNVTIIGNEFLSAGTNHIIHFDASGGGIANTYNVNIMGNAFIGPTALSTDTAVYLNEVINSSIGPNTFTNLQSANYYVFVSCQNIMTTPLTYANGLSYSTSTNTVSNLFKTGVNVSGIADTLNFGTSTTQNGMILSNPNDNGRVYQSLNAATGPYFSGHNSSDLYWLFLPSSTSRAGLFLGSTFYIQDFGGGNDLIWNNGVYNGSNSVYTITGGAGYVEQSLGDLYVANYASGTGGTNITGTIRSALRATSNTVLLGGQNDGGRGVTTGYTFSVFGSSQKVALHSPPAGAFTNSYLTWNSTDSTIKQVTPLVASADSLAKTGTISSVTTYTPGTTGAFTINVYTSITAISAGTLTITVTFTDENSTSQTVTLIPMGGTVGGLTGTGFTAFPTANIRASAHAITVVATFSGSSITYDIGAQITQLR